MGLTAKDLDVDMQTAPMTEGDGILEDWDRIRDNDPVFFSEKTGCWLLTSWDDVSAAYLQKLPVMNAGRVEMAFHSIPMDQWEKRIPNLVKYSRMWIVSMDGEKHARLRMLLMKALSRSVIESVRPYARARAEHLMDWALSQPNGEVEFNEGIARAMAGNVLYKLLGMPESMFPVLKDWATALVEGAAAANPSPQQLERADWSLVEMNKAVLQIIEERRKEPQPDLISALLNASEGGDRLTDDEICAQMHVAIVAGHDTTMNTLTLSTKALAEHPEAWDYIYQNPDRIGDCVAELQRFVAMSSGQPRLIAEDFELHGKQLKKGQLIAVLIAAANRDPKVFANPDKLDFTRDTQKSLVFAPGVHFCLGHMLAKMQLSEFISTMVNKASGVEVLDKTISWMPVWVFRGVYSMNVRFTPRQ